MKLIRPVTVTNSILTSSNVPETDYTAWSGATAYTQGVRCILVSTHKIYECLVANTNFSPALTYRNTHILGYNRTLCGLYREPHLF